MPPTDITVSAIPVGDCFTYSISLKITGTDLTPEVANIGGDTPPFASSNWANGQKSASGSFDLIWADLGITFPISWTVELPEGCSEATPTTVPPTVTPTPGSECSALSAAITVPGEQLPEECTTPTPSTPDPPSEVTLTPDPSDPPSEETTTPAPTGRLPLTPVVNIEEFPVAGSSPGSGTQSGMAMLLTAAAIILATASWIGLKAYRPRRP